MPPCEFRAKELIVRHETHADTQCSSRRSEGARIKRCFLSSPRVSQGYADEHSVSAGASGHVAVAMPVAVAGSRVIGACSANLGVMFLILKLFLRAAITHVLVQAQERNMAGYRYTQQACGPALFGRGKPRLSLAT